MGQPLPWQTAPLGSLQPGARMVSCHRDAAGEWVYGAATITKVHSHHCPGGNLLMTNLQGAYLTPNHQVRRPEGEEGQKGGWAENWICAGDDTDAQSMVREQRILVNFEATQAHGILLGNRYLAKTLSSSVDAAAGDNTGAEPLPPSPAAELAEAGSRGSTPGMEAITSDAIPGRQQVTGQSAQLLRRVDGSNPRDDSDLLDANKALKKEYEELRDGQQEEMREMRKHLKRRIEELLHE